MTALSASAKLNISRVIDRAFGVLGANFARFAIYAFALSVIPSNVFTATFNALLMRPVADMAELAGLQAYFQVIIALAQIPAYAGFGAIFIGASAWFDRRQASFGSCFVRGFSAYAPLLLLNCVAFAALGVGLLLLIVPGAFLATIIIVAGPAAATERIGLLDAFRRSAWLTRGHRWRIFLILAIASVADFGFGQINSFVVRSIVASLGGVFSPTLAYISMAIGALFGTVKLMAIAAGLAALHVELRRLKEGTASETLARVFD